MLRQKRFEEMEVGQGLNEVKIREGYVFLKSTLCEQWYRGDGVGETTPRTKAPLFQFDGWRSGSQHKGPAVPLYKLEHHAPNSPLQHCAHFSSSDTTFWPRDTAHPVNVCLSVGFIVPPNV